MKEMVKNMMNRRRQEEHNDETLFLDSILDCDLMDEEEVTAEAHLLSVFEGFVPKRSFSSQNPKSKVIVSSKNDIKRISTNSWVSRALGEYHKPLGILCCQVVIVFVFHVTCLSFHHFL